MRIPLLLRDVYLLTNIVCVLNSKLVVLLVRRTLLLDAVWFEARKKRIDIARHQRCCTKRVMEVG